jgi:hypothetical protein
MEITSSKKGRILVFNSNGTTAQQKNVAYIRVRYLLSPLGLPLLDFVVLACVKHDLVDVTRGHTRMALGPVV